MRVRWLLLVLLGACTTAQDLAPIDPAALDVAFFACHVQPILDRNCAFTACHGDPGRPFFVYSMSKRRIAGDLLIGEALTDKEVCANFSRAVSFARADERSELITKPSTLDAFASLYHEGNYLFGPEDPEAECLARWMAGETLTGSVATADGDCRMPWRTYDPDDACEVRHPDCAAALAGPDLPPREP